MTITIERASARRDRIASTTAATASEPTNVDALPGGLRGDWAGRGSCVQADPDALFVRGAAQQSAKMVCQKCPVIAECLADALDNRTEFGVWGGMTERERRAMLRRHPNVPSWWNLFNTARLDQVS